jgi:hypothetical protein
VKLYSVSTSRFLLFLLLAATSALLAADFWATKKFTEWTDKEVQRMATDSPWAQKAVIALGSGRSSGFGEEGGGRTGGGGLDDIGGGGGGGGRGSRGGRGGGMDDFGSAQAGTPTVSLVIRWQSALPVRQALARIHWGAEASASPEAAKFLAGQEEYYVISVSGLPARLMGTDPEKVKSASALKIGKAAPVPAAAIQVNRGRPLSEILLAFPRPDHPIALTDKEVEVAVALGNAPVKKKFQLKNMVFDGKLAI